MRQPELPTATLNNRALGFATVLGLEQSSSAVLPLVEISALFLGEIRTSYTDALLKAMHKSFHSG